MIDRIRLGNAMKWLWLPISIAILFTGSLALEAGNADDVVAVLSGNLEPYRMSLESFQKEFGSNVRVVSLDAEEFKSRGHARVVVAFGGKAALLNYPPGTSLVYGLAPGTLIGPGQSRGTVVRISMMPAPALTVRRLQELQPSMKRLAVLWKSPAYESYVRELQRATKATSLIIDSIRLDDKTSLPAALRQLQNHADALWIPSDPLLVNAQNLVIFNQFSTSAQIPLYSPIAGLAEKGFVATLSVEYAEIGRRSAEVTRSILAGDSPPFEIYSDRIQVIINLQAAERVGITLNEAAMKNGTKVLR